MMVVRTPKTKAQARRHAKKGFLIETMKQDGGVHAYRNEFSLELYKHKKDKHLFVLMAVNLVILLL